MTSMPPLLFLGLAAVLCAGLGLEPQWWVACAVLWLADWIIDFFLSRDDDDEGARA